MASLRAAEDLIRRGRVTVDGAVAHVGQKVDPESAHVEIDGVPLPIRPGLVYYLLFKERGTISTAADPQSRPTVVDIVPPEPRVYPVGRLDVDSEGLIILTNDGDLALRLTHPRFGVTKTYVARVEGVPTAAALRRLRQGVELDDGPAAAAEVHLLDTTSNEALVEVVMGEGRKRQVRRMFAAVGYPVLRLVRIAIGPLRDPSLKPGRWRRLTSGEVHSLYRSSVG